MLRLLALALLLANGIYFAWSAGLLLPYGLGPVQQSEPHRLNQQVKPEALQLLSAQAFKRIEDQAKAEREPKECLQAGPFDPAQAEPLRAALEANMPAGTWQLTQSAVSARWILYMGKFASNAVLAKKRAELAALKVPTEPLGNAALEPGLSLGGFETKAEADAALVRLAARVRTARVVQERADATVFALQLPAVTAELKPKLAALQTALADKPLVACH
jgi:hypothetical protein